MANTAAYISNVSAIPDADLKGVTIKYTVNRASGGGSLQLFRNSTQSTSGAVLVLTINLVNGNFSFDDRNAKQKAKNYYYFRELNNTTDNTTNDPVIGRNNKL